MRYTNDGDADLDSNDDGIGVLCQSPKALSLTGVNFICNSVTGTSPYFKAQIWPMSTTSNHQPDTSGTVLAETAAFQCSVGLNSVSFSSPFTTTAGMMFCCIIVHSSGTIDSSNQVGLEYIGGRVRGSQGPGMAMRENNGGTWTFNLEYYGSMTVTTDQGYHLGGHLNHGYGAVTVETAGHRFGGRFTIPASSASNADLEMHCTGFLFQWGVANSTDVIKAGAWNSAGTELATSGNIDADQVGGGSSGSIGYYLGTSRVYFQEPLTMITGGTYYLGFEHVSGSIIHNYLQMGADIATMQKSYPGGDWCRSAAWEGSAWDEDFDGSDSPGRVLISPLLSDIHGTSSVVPNTNLGVGDRGRERAPQRTTNPLKSGYHAPNAAKLITRETTEYGWDPYR